MLGTARAPGPRGRPVPGLIQFENPGVLTVLVYGYAVLWFTTPFFLASLVGSLVTIAVYRRAPDRACRAATLSAPDQTAESRRWCSARRIA